MEDGPDLAENVELEDDKLVAIKTEPDEEECCRILFVSDVVEMVLVLLSSTRELKPKQIKSINNNGRAATLCIVVF